MSNKNLPPIGKPTLAEAISLSKQQTKLEINAIKIGRIEAFDAATQRADVSIAHKQVVDVMEDGTKVYADYPVIMQCPVVVLFGGVDFLSMPIEEGDSCLLLFNDNEIDQWSSNGNGQVCSTFRMHDISDAIALVGVRPLTNAISGYLANGIRLSHGGNVTIDLKDNIIESIATMFIHNGDMTINGDLTVNGTITATGNILGDGISLNSHTHGGVQTGGGNTGAPNT